MAALILVGGALVIAESWFTALGFLHRRPLAGLGGRWKIFLAALVPWVLGLGLAAALMLGLFYLSDWASWDSVGPGRRIARLIRAEPGPIAIGRFRCRI